MPIRYNLDHQTQVLAGGVAVKPGAGHVFTEAELARGIAGLWSEENPRKPLSDPDAIKRRARRES